MSRVIKFRIWDKINKQFRDPEFLGGHINDLFAPDEMYVFQQFTGLLDKNKKEIFEGDILKFRKRGGIVENPKVYIDAVEWNPNMFCRGFKKELTALGYYSCFERMWNPEIIGNIFQNPELLNETKEIPKN